MIAIEYHADLKEVQCDAHLAALLSSEAQAAPFDRLAWWDALARHCGLKPLLAVARDGEAVAVLPLQAADGNLTALANWAGWDQSGEPAQAEGGSCHLIGRGELSSHDTGR